MSIFKQMNPKSPFFRMGAGMLLVLFAAWMILPSCGCLLKELFGTKTDIAANSLGELLVDAGGLDAFGCHCHEPKPQPLEGPARVTLEEGSAKVFDIFPAEALPMSGAGRRVSSPSSRGPPASGHYLGLADGRTYLAHCTFLL